MVTFGLVVSLPCPFNVMLKKLQLTSNLCIKAGFTNGQEMAAAYIREKWPGPTAEALLAMADVGERSQEHGSG